MDLGQPATQFWGKLSVLALQILTQLQRLSVAFNFPICTSAAAPATASPARTSTATSRLFRARHSSQVTRHRES